MNNINNITIAGVDIAQDWLDVHIHKLAHVRRFTNNAEGQKSGK